MRKSRPLGRLSIAGLAVAGLAAVTGVASVASPVQAAPPTLQDQFNNVGIVAPGSAGAGNFDGVGDALSSTGLAADGLTPGATVRHDGLTIMWPNVAAGSPDNVVADGQTAALSGSGNTLGIVAASAYGAPAGTFTVNYADGTSISQTVNFADWAANKASAGTDLLATGAGLGSGLSAPVSLYYGSIAINPAETVVSVTLPTIGAGVGANVAALHIFDLTVGTAGAVATGAPGTLSYYDEARKDCVGTAANAQSQAWYTVADGTLSDVYSPTIDNTDVKSLDPIVTGTSSSAKPFTALQPRDMTYTVSQLGTTGMACRVIAIDSANDFAIVTDFITDPATNSVVMQDSLVALPGAPGDLAVYLRFNPLLNGHGGGGTNNVGGESATIDSTPSNGQIPVAYSTNSFTQATNRTYATPIYSALAASTPFSAVQTGYVGESSDGLTELDGSQQLTAGAPNANNGNVVQTVRLSFAGGGTATAPSYPTGYSTSGGTSACASSSSPTSGSSQITAAGIASAVSAASGASVSAGSVQSVTVSLGFGQGENDAVNSAIDSAAVPFATTFGEYQAQWQAYDAQLCAPPASVGTVSPTQSTQAWWLSANVIKASEDKTFLGATAASLASPWGQSVPAGNASNNLATYFGSYREVFPRDAYETFTGFLTDGDLTTARQMVNYWFTDMQLPNGSFPRNGLLNGQAAPDTGGLQLDETADPILAAWQAGLAGDASLYQNHIKPAADFLVANGPETSGSVERWEEQNGYSPSTMADEVAGLVAAANIAQAQDDSVSARLFFATADDFRNLILASTVVNTPTSNGSLSSTPYFLRVDKTGNPNQSSTYTLGNGNTRSTDQRKVIDQGFLELTRLGELSPSISLVSNSLSLVGSNISFGTPTGTGVLRYNGDGYGDCFPTGNTPPDGSTANQSCPGLGVPWADRNTGTGHPWPVLSGENAEYQVQAGNTVGATSGLNFMLNSASGVGLVPEQVWDDTNTAATAFATDPTNGSADPASPPSPTTASIGFTDGQADGSASPLTWAQAQELRLLADLGSGTIQEQPSIVASRYASVAASATPTVAVPLSVTAPIAVSGENVPPSMVRPSITVSTPSTTVTGTTTAGATVDVAVTSSPQGSAATSTQITTTTAGPGGGFSVPVTLPSGTSSVEVATTTAAGTNEALFSVTNAFVPGTVVLQAPAAPDGGSGPGTYVYPTTTADFPSNSFRITGLTVVNSGTTSTIEVGIANLQNIFGQLGGLQLIDVYIHAPAGQIPGGELQSTGAAGPSDSPDPDNYTIAPADAWNQLIQVNANGFGTFQWVTPSSTAAGLTGSPSLGTPSVNIVQLSPSNGLNPGQFNITVPNAQLGTPGPGWIFTVTLAGQGGDDGGGVAYPRQFTSTAGSFSFGVCAAGGTSPICKLSANSVPNVMDTIPPAGASVQTELNPLGGPPALQGVQISAPSITSASATTMTTGVPGSFTVQTTGQPTPTLSESGRLPNGVTFTDNGNGTATLAGTPAAGSGGVYYLTITASSSVGSPAVQTFVLTVGATTAPVATVTSTLSINLGSSALSLGSFVAGLAQTYSTQAAATVTSTAASAALTVADLSGVGVAGHLYNPSGAGYSLPQALQASGSSSAAGAVGGSLANLSAAQLTVVTYNAPVSNDTPTVTFAQPIGASDPLRTGTYSKTLTFTLSTTTP